MSRSAVSPLDRPAPATSRARVALVLTGFVMGYFGLQIPSAVRRSATFDEPLHLAAGYFALAERDYRLDVTHPPLLRMWAALPLLARPGEAPDPSRMTQWTEARWNAAAYEFAEDFIYAGPDADAWLNRARCMTLVLGALLGVLVFCWAYECLGFVPAVVGLLFYLMSPNLSAHAALVTTDLGVTCFFFGAVYFLWRSMRGWSPANLAGLALFTGLAAASKFSAVLLGPAVVLVLGVAVVRRQLSLRRALGIVVLLAAAAWGVIWAAYQFQYAPAGGIGVAQPWAALREELPVAASLLGWVDELRLLPAAYTHGFSLSFTSAGALPGYLGGEISREGWWYYFPVAFLIKTPVPLLLLAAAGVVVLVRRWSVWDALLPACLALPPAVYLGVAMSTEINLGLRHILPIYPFVVMVAAVAAAGVVRAGWRRRTQWLVLGPVVAAGILVFAHSYPRHLTFFNQLVGGPAEGPRYLVDSNLDWGQHLKLLKRWMDEHEVKRINLAYFGSADPDYYGFVDVPLPGSADFAESGGAQPRLPGYVAISATLLSGVYFSPEWRLFYAGFARLEPVAVIGNTINVYWVDRWPVALARRGAPADEIETHRSLGRDLTRLGWDDLAIIHLRRYLRRHPDNHRVLIRLGHALTRVGRMDEALPVFRRSAEVAPQEAESHGVLAALLLDRRDAAGSLPHARAYARLQPENPSAHDLLGVVLACNNQLAEAEAAFVRALELAPRDAGIREHLQMAREMSAGGAARF